MGKKEELLQIIEDGSEKQKFYGTLCYMELKNSKPYDIIRDEPEFQEILARAKIVHDERVAKYGHLFDEE